MNQQKPVVKYRQATVNMCGRNHKLRYKYTLLATITGPEAKAITDSQDAGHGLYWQYDDKKQKLEIYEDKLLPSTRK